jgi:hypothetical protein
MITPLQLKMELQLLDLRLPYQNGKATVDYQPAHSQGVTYDSGENGTQDEL